jgi:hypothetical protein
MKHKLFEAKGPRIVSGDEELEHLVTFNVELGRSPQNIASILDKSQPNFGENNVRILSKKDQRLAGKLR